MPLKCCQWAAFFKIIIITIQLTLIKIQIVIIYFYCCHYHICIQYAYEIHYRPQQMRRERNVSQLT